MGTSRKTVKRNTPAKPTEIVWFVRSLFKGMQLGIVNLPRELHHYHSHIIQALNGDTTYLKQAIVNVSSRANIVTPNKQETSLMLKWRGGMAGFYSRVLYGLEMFLQLLEEYNGVTEHGTNKIHSVTIAHPCIEYRKISDGKGTDFSRHYREYPGERLSD